MASIKKLSIRGIRSFSHERDQVIEFYTPLTMIVGANGCGKTTIIECLKYACTGALPPGARNGQSFVHDPKVSGTNEVKANIKLRFSTRDQTVSVVIRAFQLTQKRKTLQFKALDGVIRTKGENGQSVSINHKCTEMDKHIPLRLGVSKAILENVVFCHQEDASWPLQEGAVVKKKFDDIFESARYTKALDTIKKTKQEYASVVKDLKVDLAGLQERLRAAQSLKGELESSTEAYSSIRKEIETLDARNKELSESLEKLRAVADEVGMLEGRKQSLLLTCRDLEVRMGEKRENIGDGGDLSAASDENLQKELEEFDAKLAACADEIRFYSDEADRCAQRANAAKKQKDRLQGEQGSLQAQLSQQERVVEGRDGMMESLSKRYDIFNPAPSAGGGSEAASSRYTSDDVSSFEEALRAAMDKAQVTFNEVRAKTRAEEDSMNAELNALKIEQQGSADAVEAKERELRKIQNDAMSLAGSASGGPGSQSQLGMATVSKLKRELEAAEKAKERAIKDSDDFFKNDKTQEVAREIKELEGRLSQIRVGVEEEEANVKALSSQQHEQSQIQVKTAQIEDDEGRLDERVREGPAFNSSFVSSPPQEVSQAALGSVSTELKMASSKLEGERVDKAREVMSLHREVAQNNTNLVNTKRDKSRVALQLEDLSSAVKVVQESMEGVPNPSPGEALDAEKHFDWILDHYVKKEKRMSKSASIVKFAEMYAESVLNHAEQEHSCLTCHRLLTDEEHEELKRIQADQIEKGKADAQAKQDGMGSSHAECKATIKRLTDVGDTWKQWLRLSSRPPELAEEQARLEQEAAEKKQELEKEEQEEKRLLASRQKVDEDLREVERCLEEAIRIDGVRIEVNQIKEKLQRYNQNKGTLGEAQERLRELTSDKDKVITDVQAKTKKLTSIGNHKYEVTTARNMREADYDKAFSNLEAKKEFDKKREILRERERSLEGEVKDLKAKEQPLRQQLQEKTKQQARAKEKGRAAQDRLQTTFQECQQDVKAFSRSQREVAAGMAKNLPETLTSIQARLQEVESTVKENEEAARENERTMSGKVLMSDKQEQHKKVLKDNIDYRALKSKLREQQKEVAQVEKEISETDSEDFRGKMDQINAERNKNVQRRAELKGRLHGIKNQIHGFQAKLESDPYRNVEEKHRRKMIEHRTTEMAVTDLDKYWTALDKALLRFHTMKIADINKIIRELWAMTYSGEDIDMIEIVSGDDEDAGKAKRSYNYRVVMRKNDATLDMKGRCSAGQRVLASVVIRLALAETFCVSCGILALDEPTTNLDHNNKVGLAHALAKIISSRSKQSNFQLITITHDEEFVQTMRTELGTQGGFSMPEFYWRISREEISRGKFYSRIDRLDWEDM